MTEDKLISVHIEKTAGTSVQELLETVAKEQLLIYNPVTDALSRSSDLRTKRTSLLHNSIREKFGRSPSWHLVNRFSLAINSGIFKPKTIEVGGLPQMSDYFAIHGHFQADRFNGLVLSPVISMVVRDPLLRMESQENHWRRYKGWTQWRKRIPFNPTMTFEEYALLPELQNYQSQALGKKSLDEIEVVGIMERLDLFILSLAIKLEEMDLINRQRRHLDLKWLNKRPHSNASRPGYSRRFLEEFKEFHNKDYALYRDIERLRKE